MLVMKFGGTSMGSAERMKIAAQICTEQKSARPTVAVVSAMSKVTDLLLETLRHAEGGDRDGVRRNVENLTARHFEVCKDLLSSRAVEYAITEISGMVREFERIAEGILLLGERPPRSVDEAIAIGERLSAMLLATYLNSTGVPAQAVNAREVIVTDAFFGNATPLLEPTRDNAAKVLKPLLAENIIPIVTGFNGATLDGRPTTLGRGGSDFSASILAGAMDAEELWIWTDVDGIMTADPRLVKDAAVLAEVTYREAAELAYNGAKVLHPRTLAPLVEKQIPVWSKNSFNLEAPGTKIVPHIAVAGGARAVTSMSNVALVSLEPASAELGGTAVMARALAALSRVNAEVLCLSSSSYRQNFCFLIRKDELTASMTALESEFSLELAHDYLHAIDVDENVGLLAVVGEGMQGTKGLAGRVFTAISRNDVNIIAIAQGSSELTIGIVVRREGLEKAVQAVHAECHMGRAAS
ncbi:MAG: aspartate kinase [Bryobacteraceae bacterium]|nr:aspartate kinase [Bryobacteraceae bacterium]